MRAPTLALSAAAAALALVLTVHSGCARTPPSAPAVLMGSENRVFLILPLNVAAVMPDELEHFSPIVWKELEVYLREQGKQLKTISRQAARTLWLRSVQQARAGENGARAGYDDAASALARELRRRAEFDTLIAPSLFLREARITRRSARWDGVERKLEIDARGFAARSFAASTPLEGAAPAASLHVVAFDAQGAKLHDAQGGLELLVRVRVEPKGLAGEPSFDFATRTDLFTNREHVREGIDAAFVPFLPPLPE